MSIFTSKHQSHPGSVCFNCAYMKVLLGFLLISIFLLAGCSRLFFYPQKELLRRPSDIGVGYEEVHFLSEDGVNLSGWFLPARGYAKGTILFFHGNAENISTHVAAVYWLPEQGFNVFIIDYRGFGNSDGKPDIEGVHLDAQASLSYLVKRDDVDPDRIIIFGQSIGGAIAIYTAATSNIPLRAVIAESSFSSYPDIMQEKLSEMFLTWPFQWLAKTMTTRYDPVKVIQDISPVPLLLIHGDNDVVVSVRHTYKLYEAAQDNKQLWILENGGHISAFVPKRKDYRQRLVCYMETVLASSKTCVPKIVVSD